MRFKLRQETGNFTGGGGQWGVDILRKVGRNFNGRQLLRTIVFNHQQEAYIKNSTQFAPKHVILHSEVNKFSGEGAQNTILAI